jgi:Flp pilus assembly protein TadG
VTRSLRPADCRRRSESGSALVELTWLGLLLLIPLVYVVITIVTVQRSAYGATEAARAAGRAFVLSPNLAAAQARAVQAAELAMHDQGISLSAGDVVIVCHPTPQSCLQPGSTVEVDLNLQVGLPLLPSFGSRPTASVAVQASHVEPYGVYREATQ